MLISDGEKVTLIETCDEIFFVLSRILANINIDYRYLDIALYTCIRTGSLFVERGASQLCPKRRKIKDIITKGVTCLNSYNA